jgi:hypothetical protein
MTVNCPSEATAHAFADHFDRREFAVPNAGAVELLVAVEHVESGWECPIIPYVWETHGGVPRKVLLNKETEDIDACAKVLYERLGRLYNYRFALTGFEVGDWRSAGALVDDLSPGGLYEEQHIKQKLKNWNGLVISEALWETANMPDGFVPFGAQASGYFWVPYTTIEDSR